MIKNIVTPELKDKVLISLLSEDSPEVEFNDYSRAKELGINPKLFIAILNYFERYGLISQDDTLRGDNTVYLNIEAYDLYSHGGFVAQEEILKANLEKLGKELDLLSKQLSPDLLDQVAKITSISNSILSVLPLFLSHQE